MKLERPIVFFDVETTSLDISQAKICQFSAIRVMPDGSEHEYDAYINPGIPMPAEASEVNHITDDMLKDKPSFKEALPVIAALLKDADLGGYNIINYDIPVLMKEFEQAGSNFPIQGRNIIDAFSIFCMKERRNLAAASEFYLNKKFEEGAHNSMEDTRVTLDVFKAQLEKYEDIPSEMKELHKLIRGNKVDLQGKIILNNENIPVFNFGKYKNRSIKDVAQFDPSYIQWICRNVEFSSEFRYTLLNILK